MPNLHPQLLLFSLSLLFVGIAFCTGGDLLTKQLLSFSYRTLDKLQVDTLPPVVLMLDFTLIDLEINPEDNFTQVQIKTENSLLKKLELEISTSNSPEVAIAKELGLYPQIQKLQLNQHVKVEIPLDLIAIKATIEKEKKISLVEVITTNSIIKKLDFVLPIAEINQLDYMTAKLLNSSIEDVRKLISYQIKNQSVQL